jgi:hypothetical protein
VGRGVPEFVGEFEGDVLAVVELLVELLLQLLVYAFVLLARRQQRGHLQQREGRQQAELPRAEEPQERSEHKNVS